MDSQLTLLNPSPPPSLLFSTRNIRNTSIYLSSDPSPRTPRYTVTTDNAKPGSGTRIVDARAEGGERVIAVLYLKDVLPDVIVFPGGQWQGGGGEEVKVKVNKWLRKGVLPDKYPIRILSPAPGVCYYWKTDKVYRLALYNEQDRQYPIATFQLGPSPTSPLSLSLEREAEGIIEMVIVSFIILELKMRIKENEAQIAQSRGLADYR